MCDNCRKGLNVVEQNCNRESLIILEFVQLVQAYRSNVTLKMLVELLRGKKLGKNYLRKDLVEKYSGFLKTMKESDLRRLCIKLLAIGALEEIFVS